MHITRELILACCRGTIHRRQFHHLAYEHLLDRCPHCRDEFEVFNAQQRDPGLFTSALARVAIETRPQMVEFERRQQQAAKWVDELLELPADEQASKIGRARRKSRGPWFASRLLAEARKLIPGAPRKAIHLTTLAEMSLVDSLPDQLDLVVLITAHHANALRALGDLEAADRLFTRVCQSLDAITELEWIAEILEFEASLRMAQRRFGAVASLISRALLIQRVLANRSGEGRLLVKLATSFYNQGRYEDASATIEDALGLLKTTETPGRTFVCALHNSILYRLARGQFDQAAEMLHFHKETFEKFRQDPMIEFQHHWLSGRISLELGALEKARDHLGRSQSLAWNAYDRSLIKLDLATVYLKQERHVQSRDLTREIVPTLVSYKLHEDPSVALQLAQLATN